MGMGLSLGPVSLGISGGLQLIQTWRSPCAKAGGVWSYGQREL